MSARDDIRWLMQRRPVSGLAKAIPAAERTIYRIERGEVQRPSLAVREGILRLRREIEQTERQSHE